MRYFFSKSQPFTKAHKREVGPNRLWSTNSIYFCQLSTSGTTSTPSIITFFAIGACIRIQDVSQPNIQVLLDSNLHFVG